MNSWVKRAAQPASFRWADWKFDIPWQSRELTFPGIPPAFVRGDQRCSVPNAMSGGPHTMHCYYLWCQPLVPSCLKRSLSSATVATQEHIISQSVNSPTHLNVIRAARNTAQKYTAVILNFLHRSVHLSECLHVVLHWQSRWVTFNACTKLQFSLTWIETCRESSRTGWKWKVSILYADLCMLHNDISWIFD